jgi:peptide/nickel transport system substrate-binding protein
VINAPFWVYFADQWDPKSPWSNPNVRKAVTLGLDRDGINQALTLGHSLITYSIVPKDYEGYWQPPKIPYDPAAAKKLLADAGFKNGFDGGEYFCDASYSNLGEAAVNSLAEIGIKMKLRPMERAAFTKEYGEKKYRNLIQGGSGAFGNAATRMETFVVKGGTYVYGSYPDIDDLFAQQAQSADKAKRTDLVRRMQQLVHERTVYAPLWQLGFLNGQGRRVEDAAFNLIPGHPYSAPYEDLRLKGGA